MKTPKTSKLNWQNCGHLNSFKFKSISSASPLAAAAVLLIVRIILQTHKINKMFELRDSIRTRSSSWAKIRILCLTSKSLGKTASKVSQSVNISFANPLHFFFIKPKGRFPFGLSSCASYKLFLIHGMLPKNLNERYRSKYQESTKKYQEITQKTSGPKRVLAGLSFV